jgi:hypothetical protein
MDELMEPWNNKSSMPRFFELISKMNYINVQEGLIKLKRNDIMIPKIKHVKMRLDEIKRDKVKNIKESYLLQEKILGNSSSSDADIAKFQNLHTNINTLNEESQLLHKYIKDVNYKFHGASNNDLNNQYKREKKFTRKKELLQSLKEDEKLAEIDYYVIKKHKIVEQEGEVEEVSPEETKVKKPKVDKKPKAEKTEKKEAKSPVAKIVITPQQINQIKTNVRKLLQEKFRFSNKEECASLKRSQAYYMTKEDIIATIEDTPDIKAIMPSNYKSLKKEQICEYLT